MVFDYFESSLGLKNEGILKNIKDRIFSHFFFFFFFIVAILTTTVYHVSTVLIL
jgi:hypothetical protein